MGELVADIDGAGHANSLTQVTLRLTLPGFPDTYQGTELWDDSLVDPDNRRAVDFDRSASDARPCTPDSAATHGATERDSGLPKLFLSTGCCISGSVVLMHSVRPERTSRSRSVTSRRSPSCG